MKLLVTKMSKMSIWFICSLIAYMYIYYIEKIQKVVNQIYLKLTWKQNL